MNHFTMLVFTSCHLMILCTVYNYCFMRCIFCEIQPWWLQTINLSYSVRRQLNYKYLKKQLVVGCDASSHVGCDGPMVGNHYHHLAKIWVSELSTKYIQGIFLTVFKVIGHFGVIWCICIFFDFRQRCI